MKKGFVVIKCVAAVELGQFSIRPVFMHDRILSKIRKEVCHV
jgi:hypothetical protein